MACFNAQSSRRRLLLVLTRIAPALKVSYPSASHKCGVRELEDIAQTTTLTIIVGIKLNCSLHHQHNIALHSFNLNGLRLHLKFNLVFAICRDATTELHK
jgi:hypothetical protein